MKRNRKPSNQPCAAEKIGASIHEGACFVGRTAQKTGTLVITTTADGAKGLFGVLSAFGRGVVRGYTEEVERQPTNVFRRARKARV